MHQLELPFTSRPSYIVIALDKLVLVELVIDTFCYNQGHFAGETYFDVTAYSVTYQQQHFVEIVIEFMNLETYRLSICMLVNLFFTFRCFNKNNYNFY